MSNQHKVYTVKEEVAHALTHGIGAVLSIVALVFMLIWAAAYGDGWHVVAASIYGASLILLYTASTLYHAFPWPKMKAVFQQLDHAAIYILIAGTYTPFALINLRDAWGWTLLGVAWGIALVGVVLELTLKKRIAWLSLTLYLGMGKGKQKKGYWVHLTDSGRAYRVHDISTRPTLGMDISMVSPTERCSHHGIWPIMLTRTLPRYGSRLLPNKEAS